MLWLLQWYPNFWLLTGFVVCFGSMIGSAGPAHRDRDEDISRSHVGTIYGVIVFGSGSARHSARGAAASFTTSPIATTRLIAFALVSVVLG
jgi:hypothetical protein